YALKEWSTAVGTLTKSEGEGAIAIGRKTNVFSYNAIASTNKTLVLKEAIGTNVTSSGKNVLAMCLTVKKRNTLYHTDHRR
uniref:hypothetical protein n=1 Tax=Streptobacillus moniliformis TaxID=34105 RepID=UPI000A9AF28C